MQAPLKPAPENMSDYCRAAATRVFDDLITSLTIKVLSLIFRIIWLTFNASLNEIKTEGLVSWVQEE